MAVYVVYDKVSDNTGKITCMIYNVYPEQMVENGVMTEYTKIPVPENIKDMGAVPYINLNTKEIYYEYVAVSPPSEPLQDQIEVLKTQLSEAQAATLELHESQTLQDAKIQEANNATLELYELIAQGGAV